MLRRLRQRTVDPEHGKPLSQARFVSWLEQATGHQYSYSPQSFSDWERGRRLIPASERGLLVGLICVLRQAGGIASLDEADALLEAGGYRFLDVRERLQVDPVWGAAGSGHFVDEWAGARENESPTRQAASRGAPFWLPPASYARLFGLEPLAAEISELLSRPGPPCVVVVSGIGGIGKTSLADRVSRGVYQAGHCQGVLFARIESKVETPGMKSRDVAVTVASQLAAQLDEGLAQAAPSHQRREVGRRLKERQFLVLIDNVEEVAELEKLLQLAFAWCQPSRLLITSRARPATHHPARLVTLSELSEEDAVRLIRHEAERLGIRGLAKTTTESLQPIVAATGGNPLALKLVVAQAAVWPMEAVLRELRQAQTVPVEQMYRHIYWRAWRGLSEQGRQLLTAMPLVGNHGATLEQLQEMSGIPFPGVMEGLQELHRLALLESRGTVWERRYGIHRLTESFLLTDIIGWE